MEKAQLKIPSAKVPVDYIVKKLNVPPVTDRRMCVKSLYLPETFSAFLPVTPSQFCDFVLPECMRGIMLHPTDPQQISGFFEKLI